MGLINQHGCIHVWRPRRFKKQQQHVGCLAFFHLDSWGCLQFKHGPRARLQRCPSPSGSLITVTWTWEVMWDSLPQITSSWIWPEGEDSAGQTWLALSAKPGINSHQLPQGGERLTGRAGLNICHVCGLLAWCGLGTWERVTLKIFCVC